MLENGQNPFKSIREKAGLSIRAFAETLGVSVPTIYNVESGITKSPVEIFQLFSNLGYDSVSLEESYNAWRKANLKKTRASIMHCLSKLSARGGESHG
jgi:transcriptional regulator with XRE-family HTH domain